MKRKWVSEEISSCNSSSLTEVASSDGYDIFLSFRGLDTRKTITAHIYERLTRVGFKVYKDEIEMEKGEDINGDLKKAISRSRVCIPIFSKNYALSKACLRELSHMIDCNKKIIPIFYNVTPDDVKLKTREYKDALLKHHGDEGLRNEIEKWKEALVSAAEISGYDLVNKNEADEITSITEYLMKLMPKDQDLTNSFIDVDDQVEQVEALLCLSSDGCRIIGVHGLGGIGKTTLARVIFNKLHSSFDGCSFLENVREKLQSGRHLELQQQLYKDIIDPKLAVRITNRNEGINQIKRGLVDKKIILVLDDISDVEQLEELLGNELCFAKGSRIIVTTRDRGVLHDLKKYKEVLDYKVEEMKNHQALKLFCRSAFKEDSPRVGYESLAKLALSYAEGIPLVLKVMGSLLGCIEKDAWEETLEELKTSPENKIKKAMMICYEALNWYQQKIFLDIGNYHGDLHKEYACYMWKDCKWKPNEAIRVLLNRSLINVVYKDNNNRNWKCKGGWEHHVECLHMHDVLKDFGRDIVREQSENCGGLPNRLHINKNLDDLHGIKEEKARVETLSISSATITSEDMAGLCKLRFLELRYCTLMGDFKDYFPKLRWLSLEDANLRLINFNPKNLVVLSNSCRNTNLCWDGWRAFKADKLKVLDLDARWKRLSDIGIFNSELKNLTQLCIRSIDFSYSLDWIGNLTSLCKLYLSGMEITKLRDLPSSLTHLYIGVPEEEMQMYRSNNLSKLKNIIELELYTADYSVKENDDLSFDWIVSATNLEKLCLDIPYFITNLEKVAELSRLKHLDVANVKFQNLQHLPSSLLHLELSDCEFLTRGILDVSNLKNLERLSIRACDSLEEVRDVSSNGLESLTQLKILGCPSLERLPNLSKSKKLSRFQLHACENIRNIQGFTELELLEYVGFSICKSLELSPADLSKLENRQWGIVIRACEKLPYIDRW